MHATASPAPKLTPRRMPALLCAVLLCAAFLPAQTPPADPALDQASTYIGRALILRGSFAADDLNFDAAGHLLKGDPKTVDWTLAGFDLQKVTRRDPATLELEGVRVAIRYNPDAHIFERHPQKEEKLKILLALNPEARNPGASLTAIFSTGIDPALQRAMPPYWRHYFSPALPWPDDDLSKQTILPATAPPTPGVEFPVLEKKQDADFTPAARQDRVKGVVQMRMVVAGDGIPRRITIKQPLGYGLDAEVAQILTRYHFRPGTRDGQPIPVEMILNQQFDTVPTR